MLVVLGLAGAPAVTACLTVFGQCLSRTKTQLTQGTVQGLLP
jgi:hypothetical protein